jgi:hypothetical protein
MLSTSSTVGQRGRRVIAAALTASLIVLTAARAAPQSAAATAARPASSASLPSARDVIERHIEGVGGRAALLRINSRYVWARYAIPARGLKGSVYMFAARPNKRLIRIEYPELGTAVTGFDGTVGWTAEPNESPKLVRGRQLAQLRDESAFDFDLHDEQAVRSMETIEVAEFEGRPCYKLRVVTASLRESLEFYEVASGLFAGSISQRETDKGLVTLKTIVSNYKQTDDVRLPRKLVLRSAGVEQVVTIMGVTHNKVDDSVFEVPLRLRSGVTR